MDDFHKVIRAIEGIFTIQAVEIVGKIGNLSQDLSHVLQLVIASFTIYSLIKKKKK